MKKFQRAILDFYNREIFVGVYKENYDKIKWSKKPFNYKPYKCPITGRTIDGKREHNENLQLHGCRIHEKGEFEDVKKNGKKRTEAAMDAAIDKSVDAIAKQIDL
jgi:hypothetical protein